MTAQPERIEVGDLTQEEIDAFEHVQKSRAALQQSADDFSRAHTEANYRILEAQGKTWQGIASRLSLDLAAHPYQTERMDDGRWVVIRAPERAGAKRAA